MDMNRDLLSELFSAVGGHLEEAEAPAMIIVVGGASLSATGIVERTTTDVDTIARIESRSGNDHWVRARPFPEELRTAISKVARDFALPPDWLNTEIDQLWDTGLPPEIETDITWERYGALTVGFVGRRGLIPLKLYAAVDQGIRSIHWQDLVALRPTNSEIERAAEWVRRQDIGPEFQSQVGEASERLRKELGEG